MALHYRIKDLSLSFAAMSEDQRVSTVRCVLLAFSAPPDETNDFMNWNPSFAHSCKRERLSEDFRARATAQYALLGKVLRQSSFAAAVQINPRTISEHVTSKRSRFSLNSKFTVQKPLVGEKGISLFKQLLCCCFWIYMESCMQLRFTVDVDILKRSLLHFYLALRPRWSSHHVQEKLPGLLDSAIEQAGRDVALPASPLTFHAFCKFCKQYSPTLRIMKSGSYFCDTCTKLENYITSAGDAVTRRCLSDARDIHRQEVFADFKNYLDLQRAAHGNPAGVVHLVFDFVEKVLLLTFCDN